MDCRSCNGNGETPCMCSSKGSTSIKCEKCRGKGYVDCLRCNGTGLIE